MKSNCLVSYSFLCCTFTFTCTNQILVLLKAREEVGKKSPEKGEPTQLSRKQLRRLKGERRELWKKKRPQKEKTREEEACTEWRRQWSRKGKNGAPKASKVGKRRGRTRTRWKDRQWWEKQHFIKGPMGSRKGIGYFNKGGETREETDRRNYGSQARQRAEERRQPRCVKYEQM